MNRFETVTSISEQSLHTGLSTSSLTPPVSPKPSLCGTTSKGPRIKVKASARSISIIIPEGTKLAVVATVEAAGPIELDTQMSSPHSRKGSSASDISGKDRERGQASQRSKISEGTADQRTHDRPAAMNRHWPWSSSYRRGRLNPSESLASVPRSSEISAQGQVFVTPHEHLNERNVDALNANPGDLHANNSPEGPEPSVHPEDSQKGARYPIGASVPFTRTEDAQEAAKGVSETLGPSPRSRSDRKGANNPPEGLEPSTQPGNAREQAEDPTGASAPATHIEGAQEASKGLAEALGPFARSGDAREEANDPPGAPETIALPRKDDDLHSSSALPSDPAVAQNTTFEDELPSTAASPSNPADVPNTTIVEDLQSSFTSPSTPAIAQNRAVEDTGQAAKVDTADSAATRPSAHLITQPDSAVIVIAGPSATFVPPRPRSVPSIQVHSPSGTIMAGPAGTIPMHNADVPATPTQSPIEQSPAVTGTAPSDALAAPAAALPALADIAADSSNNTNPVTGVTSAAPMPLPGVPLGGKPGKTKKIIRKTRSFVLRKPILAFIIGRDLANLVHPQLNKTSNAAGAATLSVDGPSDMLTGYARRTERKKDAQRKVLDQKIAAARIHAEAAEMRRCRMCRGLTRTKYLRKFHRLQLKRDRPDMRAFDRQATAVARAAAFKCKCSRRLLGVRNEVKDRGPMPPQHLRAPAAVEPPCQGVDGA